MPQDPMPDPFSYTCAEIFANADILYPDVKHFKLVLGMPVIDNVVRYIAVLSVCCASDYQELQRAETLSKEGVWKSLAEVLALDVAAVIGDQKTDVDRGV